MRSNPNYVNESEQWRQLAQAAFRGDGTTPQPTTQETILDEKKRHWAAILCANAQNATSLALADKLVKQWFGCGCGELDPGASTRKL